MPAILDAAASHQVVLASAISPDTLIGKYGLIGLAIILFLEVGVLLFFFMPGDTLLFSAGLLLATHSTVLKHAQPLAVWLIVLPVAVIVGNVLGYLVGQRGGPAVFSRPKSRIFRPDFVTRSERFFQRFGPLAVVLAGFVPVVRTVATVMAGVSKMRFTTYLAATIVGALLWADGVFLIGYGLGKIHYVQQHQHKITSIIDPLVVVVVLASLTPVAIHWWKGRKVKSA